MARSEGALRWGPAVQVPRGASQVQIKDAYRRLQKRFHPDRGIGGEVSSALVPRRGLSTAQLASARACSTWPHDVPHDVRALSASWHRCTLTCQAM